ncbi:DUF4886 domain-containing protein [Paludisphaera borealis]|uniref:DUF4886 domain-containing protein n=1 Tax=Paludisphaera borealis TaxID=1387353 RepID=UPI001AEF7FCA|nr:DUF4886 domain-containing protein [Paludisphaera borealis]
MSLILVLPILVGAGKEEPRTVRLLTVGNSFSGNATHYLSDVVTAAGDVLVHHQAAIPGGTLEQHWEKFQRHEADPNDPRGLYSTKMSLKQELAAEPWDYVTIQQASIKSHDVSTYRPFARRLVDLIRVQSPRAKVLVHETWAYRRDDPRFAVKSPGPGEPADQEAMYRGLSHAYRTIAGELGAAIIPVGDAFHLADADPEWGYRPDPKFDFAKATFPALPKQTHSLHLGWKWSKRGGGRYALDIDGHHANVAGEYLGGCVFYEVLYGKSVVGNAFRPRGINADYARFLQETAHRAVAGSRVIGARTKTLAEATR